VSDRHNDVRFGRPVRIRIDPLLFSRGIRERQVLFTNGPYDKGTEWLDDDAFPAITGWRRMHALASMRAMLGTLAFATCCERRYRAGLQDALDDGWGAITYLRRARGEPDEG
jgi:hypothetical protein